VACTLNLRLASQMPAFRVFVTPINTLKPPILLHFVLAHDDYHLYHASN